MTLPLSNIRVLEFSHAVLGPTCGLVLADLGAEVIKIEPPGGDPTRRLKGFGMGFTTFYNRNKKSMVVNLKSEPGREIIHRLLPNTDILIENFGPGTMERLGFGYDDLAERYPHLIYVALKGFLPGPYEKRMALDEVVQMMSGLAYMTGPPGQPLRAGTSIVDIMTGLCGAMGAIVAVQERERTSKGQFVKSALFETAAFLMGQHMAYSAQIVHPVPPMPGRVSAWAIYHQFNTADNQRVFIGVTSDKQWARFCQAFNRLDLFNDERYTTNNSRIDHNEPLMAELIQLFANMTLADIITKSETANIPFSPIARPENLFTDPQLTQGNSLINTTLPDGSPVSLPRFPLQFDNQPLPHRSTPPEIGQHTHQLLTELGYTSQTIETLAQQNITN